MLEVVAQDGCDVERKHLCAPLPRGCCVVGFAKAVGGELEPGGIPFVGMVAGSFGCMGEGL